MSQSHLYHDGSCEHFGFNGKENADCIICGNYLIALANK